MQCGLSAIAEHLIFLPYSNSFYGTEFLKFLFVVFSDSVVLNYLGITDQILLIKKLCRCYNYFITFSFLYNVCTAFI